MSRKLLIAVLALVVVGGGALTVVAFGALGGTDDSSSTDEQADTAGRAPKSPPKPRFAGQQPDDSPPEECTNLTATPKLRAQLKGAVKGSIYFGACNGRYWSTARFGDGSDGVFRHAKSSGAAVRIGSISEAKCKVPYGLLESWRQEDDCIAASSDPSADPDDPQSTVKPPDPDPSREEPSPNGQRRYENGRTWIEQYNWCQIMRDQGVPCTVPPPP
jgi:hypothetical protein